MDTAQLYLELQECGDCLMQAIDSERKNNSAHGGKSRNWFARLQATQREVQSAAEHYAMALQRYRTAITELLPEESTRPASRVRRRCGKRGTPGVKAASASFGRGFSKHQ